MRGRVGQAVITTAVVTAVVSMAAAPAHATTTTTVTANLAKTAYKMIDVGTAGQFNGSISPQHPASARARLDELVNGSWHSIKSVTSVNGVRYSITTPVLKSYRFHTYRVCVPAIGKFARGCTYRLHAVAGRLLWLSSLTPTAHSGGFSTGPMVIDGATKKHSLRWVGSTLNGSVTYDVHGKCAYGWTGIGVEDGAADGNVTFAVYADGVRLSRQTVGAGPYYDTSFQIAGRNVFRFTGSSPAVGETPGAHYGFGRVEAFCAIAP